MPVCSNQIRRPSPHNSGSVTHVAPIFTSRVLYSQTCLPTNRVLYSQTCFPSPQFLYPTNTSPHRLTNTNRVLYSQTCFPSPQFLYPTNTSPHRLTNRVLYSQICCPVSVTHKHVVPLTRFSHYLNWVFYDWLMCNKSIVTKISVFR